MAIVERTIVLTGARAGQTCKLNHGRFHFTDGKLVLRGDGEQIAGLVKILADQYQAYEVGDPRLEAAHGQCDLPEDPEHPDEEPALLGGGQPDGEGTPPEEAGDLGRDDDPNPGEARVRPEGDRHPNPRLDRVREALAHLDHGTDAHWTQEGLPKVAVVARIAKLDDLMRCDIKAAAPDFQHEG